MPTLSFEKLNRELKPGVSIISVSFYNSEVTGIEKMRDDDQLRIKIHGEEDLIISKYHSKEFPIGKKIKGFALNYFIDVEGIALICSDFYHVE